MAEAIDYPRFFTYSSGGNPAAYIVEDKIPETTLEGLSNYGEKTDVRKYGDYFGTAQGILYLKDKMNGGADSRRLGVPVGY
jgi:gamma-glutamyltranspeptidase/glutathione hydrolase